MTTTSCASMVELALDRPARDAAHEVALQEYEHRKRQRHLQHGGGGEELPASAERGDELSDDDCERAVRAGTEEGQRDQEVVPDPEEDEDRQRRDRWNRHRDGDAQEPNGMTGAVNFRRLEDLARQTAQVNPQQEDLERKHKT